MRRCLVAFYCVAAIFYYVVQQEKPQDLRKSAALYTPYFMIPGGGEKYLLSLARCFQTMGYAVVLLLEDGNICKTKRCVTGTANSLGVGLVADDFAVKIVNRGDLDTIRAHRTYEAFVLVGNSVFPTFAGIGRFNFYICQFPFDFRDFHPDLTVLKHLTTYQVVLLYSQFSARWYSKAISPFGPVANFYTLAMPQMYVLYPAVDAHDKSLPFASRKHIAVLGRVFTGRQSKGHNFALQLFRVIKESLPDGTQLFLMGHLHPGFEDHVREMKFFASKYNIPAHFQFGSSRDEIFDVLSRALVFWHLTGIQIDEDDDAASIEHFGISVVEAMNMGCIPIVTNRGGPTEIVRNGVDGFWASNISDVGRLTRAVYDLGTADLQQMQKNARARSLEFSSLRFQETFTRITHRTEVTDIFYRFISSNSTQAYSNVALDISSVSNDVAVIVEPGFHFAFKFCVVNVMRHLGKEWSLQVFHTKHNEAFVHSSLTNLNGVKFTRLPSDLGTGVLDYNDMLKRNWFWSQIEGENILIFQTDSVMLKRDMWRFRGFDYVGAPWHMENERYASITNGGIPQAVGNGGFSLRSKKAMVEIVNKFRANSTWFEHEDVFFARHAIRLGYNVSSRRDAYDFCLEVPCNDIHVSKNWIPTALHAAWYYDDTSRILRLLNESIRD